MTEQAQIPQKLKWYKFILPIMALIAVIAFGVLQFKQRQFGNNNEVINQSCKGRAFAEIGGPFSLIDNKSLPFDENKLKGKPSIIYFGYTFCPDVCPTSLSAMGAAFEELKTINPQLAQNITPVFITLDPKRDTPARMNEYVASGGFAKGLIGLSGTEAQTSAAARAFKVGYRINKEEKGSALGYSVDHTSILYLMDRNFKLATFFSDNTNPHEIAECIDYLGKSGL